MNEGDKKGGLPLSGVLLVLAALGFLQFAELPFFGSRPEVPEILEPSEKVNARLWQDPFSAVLNHYKKAKSSLEGSARPVGGATASLREQIDSRSGKGGRVTVLGVMVFGAPYAEETEFRRRWRYAVLSGIDESGYVPEDSEHIDFIRIEAGNDDISMANILPFEWLKNETGDSVLVLWINENVFCDHPLTRFDKLIGDLELKEKGGNELKDKMAFKIIGPAGSTCLHRMLQQLEAFKNQKSQSTWLEIYSASATIDDSLLLKTMESQGDNIEPVSDARDHIIRKFADYGISFKRTIATDRELAGILLDELALRRVASGGKGAKGKKPALKAGKDHIMLVAEWDTLYARKLLRIYEDVMKEKGIPEERLIRFSYLRGIDGILPGEEEEKKPDQAKSSDLAGDVTNLEKPIGKSQFDYLRRLAGEAFKLEQLELRPDGGSIKAIGILGSDYYDKYLALQALRQKFPDAIFFTTDLDARLLHPTNIEWTRNLVVASSFGLSWRQCESRKVPLSFRNNYQSSIFFATQLALGSQNLEDLEQAMRPRIFEIGRHNPVELEPERDAKTCEISGGNPLQARFMAAEELRVAGKLAVLAALLILLLYFSSHKVQNTINTLLKDRHYLTLGLAVVTLFFAGWFLTLVGSPNQEPFSLHEGVSIWPTEILRLVSAFVSFIFLAQATVSLRKNNVKIAEDFGFAGLEGGTGALESSDDGDHPERTGWRINLRKMIEKFFAAVDFDWKVENGGSGFTMGELWVEYLRRNTPRYRVVRQAPIITLFVVLCVVILAFFGFPMVPVRGNWSYIFDKVALFLSVGVFILLNFYVFDITRTCRRFIDLAGKTYSWSQDSVMKFSSKDKFSEGEGIEEWMVISLIADRTEVVGRLIFYPIIVWLIMFMARINYFDNWHLPIGLGIVLTMGALYAWSSAFVLRRSAEHAREATLQRLTMRLAEILRDKGQDQGRIRQIEFALKEVRSNRKGAFAPFTHHPLLQSLMIPFGGVGGWYFLEFLAKLTTGS
jgi:hypothetical protein